MAHSDFSWRKIISFIGVAILATIAVVTLSTGINLAVCGYAAHGILTALGGCSTMALAVVLYKNYQAWAEMNLTKNK